MPLEDALLNLVNRPCIGVVAQPETNGDLLMHFGAWQSYDDSPDSRLLTTERGKWSLMILCPWRLDGLLAPVCDWRSVGNRDNQDTEAQLVLEGLTVETIDLHKPGLDLELRFTGGYRLRSLCDSDGKTRDCWYLLLPDSSSLVATRDYRLRQELPER
jgi:hypothetical protein